MKKALFLLGGENAVESRKMVDRFALFLEEQSYAITIAEDLAFLDDAEKVHGQDLIVPCWPRGVISDVQEGHLSQAVNLGAGIAGWHAGMGDTFRDNFNYHFLTGGQFVARPGGIIDFTVHVAKTADPIVTGMRELRLHSDQLYLHVDPGNEVLATTTFGDTPCPWIAGCVMPVVWKRSFGAGRVFYASFGRADSDFEVPECQEIVRRGLLWASR